jgi:DNA repair protein RecN (Recombination protein N)
MRPPPPAILPPFPFRNHPVASEAGASIRAVLLELHIAGLGVIDNVDLELARGLNVLTGETGAGKTLVTVGLSLVLGRRARSGLVRAGSERGRVEALFEVPGDSAAREWGEDGQLILARMVSADGRSTGRAGGQLAPVGTLAELGAGLVEVHGQHQTQRLLAPAAQLGFLDRFAGVAHRQTLEAYREVHGRLRSGRSRLRRLEEETREREREKDLMAYQVREIESAGLDPGETARLAAEEGRLGHAERIREVLAGVVAALADEGGGADAARIASVAARDAAAMDPSLESLARRLESVAAETSDVTAELRTYLDGVELDPARLEEVRDRQAAIRVLERKYGEGEEGVLAYLAEARARLVSLECAEDERIALAEEVARLEARATELAAAISAGRLEAAPLLSAALEAELRELGMEGASVEVDLQSEDGLGPDGAETAVLLFSGGPGQPSQPMGRVASGGELSRTMLACRTVLADLDDIPTLVFDEVDAGIGGRTGVAVGRRLARLARKRQVLVVTHLPQIACFADRHFRVTKEDGTAHVAPLEGAERVVELSRMLSGMPTEQAATHAEQLLAEASREKS